MWKVYVPVLVALVVLVSLALYLDRTSDSELLQFATWGTLDELNSYQKMVDLYNSRGPRRKVRLIHVEIQFDQKLLVQAAGKKIPDVFKAYNGMLKNFGNKGIIEDLAPWVAADTSIHLDEFYDVLVQGAYDGDRLYGLPLVFSTLVLYYNKNLFDAEGLDYPDSTWTWDDAIRAGKRLLRKDENGNVVRWGGHFRIAGPVMIFQYGGDHFNDTFDRCVIGTPEAAEAVATFISFYKEHGIMFNPALRTGYRVDEMFSSGQVAMVINGRWAAPWFSAHMPPGSFDVAPMPRGPIRATGLATHFITMAANSRRKQDAWDFIRFLVSEEAQRITSDDGNNIPAMRRVAESDVFLQNKVTPWINNRVFLDQLPYARPWWWEESPYVSPNYLYTQWTFALDRIIRGEDTPLGALQKMEDEVNRVIASQKEHAGGRPFVGSALFYGLVLLVVASIGSVSLRRRSRS